MSNSEVTRISCVIRGEERARLVERRNKQTGLHEIKIDGPKRVTFDIRYGDSPKDAGYLFTTVMMAPNESAIRDTCRQCLEITGALFCFVYKITQRPDSAPLEELVWTESKYKQLEQNNVIDI